MAISPPGDILLDVARAADPAGVAAAREKLAAMSGAREAAGGFDRMVDGGARTGLARSAPASDAFTKFEAAMLQTFLQSILPKDVDAAYGGSGMSGEMWQSMFAEQLANTIAERGGIGIADRVLRDYYVKGDERIPVSGVSHDPDRDERANATDLAAARIGEMQLDALFRPGTKPDENETL